MSARSWKDAILNRVSEIPGDVGVAARLIQARTRDLGLASYIQCKKGTARSMTRNIVRKSEHAGPSCP